MLTTKQPLQAKAHKTSCLVKSEKSILLLSKKLFILTCWTNCLVT